MSKVLRVPITNDRDLILTIDFDKKIIEVESNYWTVISKKKGIESPDQVAEIFNLGHEVQKRLQQQKQQEQEEDPTSKSHLVTDKKSGKQYVMPTPEPNKKVQPSLEEKTLTKVMEIFDSIAETSFNDGGVSSKILRETLENKKVVSNYKEFTKFLNLALEKDLIEYMQDDDQYKGMYKRKK